MKPRRRGLSPVAGHADGAQVPGSPRLPRTGPRPPGRVLRSIVAPVLPPVLAAAVLGGAVLLGLSDDASAGDDRAVLVETAVSSSTALVLALGEERAATARLVREADERARPDVDTARNLVDSELLRNLTLLNGIDGAAARLLARETSDIAASLALTRAEVDRRGEADGEEYTQLCQSLASAVVSAGGVSDLPGNGRALERLGLLLSVVDAAAAERDLGLLVLNGTDEAGDSARLGLLATQQVVRLSHRSSSPRQSTSCSSNRLTPPVPGHCAPLGRRCRHRTRTPRASPRTPGAWSRRSKRPTS